MSCLLTTMFCGCLQSETKLEINPIVSGKMGHQLDSLLTPYVDQLRVSTDNTAGLAIGVMKGNDIVYARTFGLAKIETEKKVKQSTSFHIASVSKPFTAVAIVMLIQEGKLNLDDLIVEVIPDFSMKGEGYDKITIEHILTHTSGIPRNIAKDDWLNPSYGSKALEENLDIASELELDFVPGTRFSYSNSAFDILGVVIQKVANLPFDEYIKLKIFEPLEMSNTSYKKLEDKMPDNWASSHSYGLSTQLLTPYPYNERLFPSSGVVASLQDMFNWAAFHINKGNFQSVQILEEEYFDLIVSPKYGTPWGDQIGLSWFLQSYLNRPIIMHTGFDTGFECMMYIYPEDKVAIVVMANRDFSRTGRIINAASEIVFNEQLKPYDLSAKYLFSKTYNEKGIGPAKSLWAKLRTDTTDNYYIDDDEILTTGAILENGQLWKESKEVLEYFLDLSPKSTYAWRLLGNANLNLGDTTAAISCYEQSLVINPNYDKGKNALEKIKAISK